MDTSKRNRNGLPADTVKLLFFLEHLHPVIGGAERSVDTLMTRLQRKPGVAVSLFSHKDDAADAARRAAECDIVLTQLAWAEEALRLAGTLNKKSVLFFRSYENVCRQGNNSVLLSHCGQTCGGCEQRRGLQGHKPDLIIANSQYSKRLLREEHGLSSEVVYPLIDFDEVRAHPAERKYVTMNQLAYHKGADIFFKLAAAMPDQLFRIVGYRDWQCPLPIPGNLTLTGPLDAKAFYADTSVFVAPARWNETFGRTLVEAQFNGIPVISSARGAAVEDKLVPVDQLVEEVENVEAWSSKIRTVLDDYQTYAQRARAFDVSPYSPEGNVERCYQLLLKLESTDRSAPL